MTGAFQEVERSRMPIGSNQITSNFFYKLKTNYYWELRIKSIIYPHGNQDAEKDDIRKDSASSDMFVTRIILYLGVTIEFMFAVTYIKGSYMQSGTVKRDIYVHLPSHLMKRRGIMCKLQRIPYCITEASSKWFKICETRIKSISIQPLNGSGQIFTLHTQEWLGCFNIGNF